MQNVTNPLRLAILTNSFPTVSETFIFHKVLGLQKAGLDVTVWVHAKSNDTPAFAGFDANLANIIVRQACLGHGLKGAFLGVTKVILRHPVEAWHLWLQSARLYPQARRALRAWLLALPLKCGHFDLIHFEFSGLAVTYLDALPLLCPVKLLTSCRGAAEQIMPLTVPERGQQLRQVLAHMDKVHCVSAEIRNHVQRYGLRSEQAFINHPAIDPQQFQRQHPYPLKRQGPYQILSVGRLHWKKGLEFGLLAVSKLVQAGLDVQYQILGEGGEEEKLRYLIHTLGLTNKVDLLGCQPAESVRQALEEADIFLLPSLSEGLSNAVLEAMAMEVPIVSTIAGGMPEAIQDGQEGFLVPPMTPDALANKMQSLLENPTMRAEMGRVGRRRVEHQFNLRGQIDCFIEQYSTLMESNVIS